MNQILQKSIYCLLLLKLLILQCTTTTEISGVTDIPNEKVSGTVIYKDGLQLGTTSVVIRKIIITKFGDSVIFEKKTNPDILGRYYFNNIKNGVYTLYTNDTSAGMSAILSKVQKDNNELVNQDLFLANNITVKGRIITNLMNTKPVKVFIPGIGIQSFIDSNGYYKLEHVPNGQYDIGFVYNTIVNFLSVKTTGNSDTVFIRDASIDNSTGRTYNLFDKKNDSVFSINPLIYTQNPDWYSGKDFYAASYYTVVNDNLVEVDESGQTALLLDNFNDNDAFTELFSVFPDIIWYAWDDRIDSGSTVLIPSIKNNTDFSKFIEPVEGMGKAAHVKIVFGDKSKYPYAGIGCRNQSIEKFYINLSKMTAISFYIKGKGRIKVAFSSKKVDDYPLKDQWGDLQKTIDIPSEWTRITIPSSQLVPPPYSVQEAQGLKWEDVRDSIRSIHFESTTYDIAGDTTDLWLDNIFLHGIGEFNLKP